MKKIVLSGIFYPMAILRYFEAALSRKVGQNLITVGPYTGAWIPWNNGINLPVKYAKPPDHPLPQQLIHWAKAKPISIPDVDLWIQVDAGFHFDPMPEARTVVHVATDPHALNYTQQRTRCNYFFNMQKFYSEKGDIWLPYAADPVWHAPKQEEKIYDVCLIGLHYQNRTNLVNRLRSKGLNVYYDIGPVFEEYQTLYAQSRVAISWSSRDDLIARVFEAMSMAVPLVCNRVPDLPTLFVEGDHFLGFHDIDEAEEQVMYLLKEEKYAQEMAENAHRKVTAQHLYDHRIDQILETVGML